MELIVDILLDAAKDTFSLVPFLFVTYVIIEALAHTAGEKVNAVVERAGAAGPVVGALLGIVPQCGFSAMASTLYAGRIVTLGTLVAVFLSTSDEMLPIFVAERVPVSTMGFILLAKAALAIISGFGVDMLVRMLRRNPRVHALFRRGLFEHGAIIDPKPTKAAKAAADSGLAEDAKKVAESKSAAASTSTSKNTLVFTNKNKATSKNSLEFKTKGGSASAPSAAAISKNETDTVADGAAEAKSTLEFKTAGAPAPKNSLAFTSKNDVAPKNTLAFANSGAAGSTTASAFATETISALESISNLEESTAAASGSAAAPVRARSYSRGFTHESRARAAHPELDEAPTKHYASLCTCGQVHNADGKLDFKLILKSALKHTVQVTVFIFLVTVVLVAVLEGVGEPALESFLRSNETLAIVGSALVGLIPNCSASVVITQLYLEGALGFGPMMAGTLVSAGVGYLVLFRANDSARENVVILLMLYVIAVFWGFVLTAFC